MDNQFHPYTRRELQDAFHAGPEGQAFGLRISDWDKMPDVQNKILMTVREKLIADNHERTKLRRP